MWRYGLVYFALVLTLLAQQMLSEDTKLILGLCVCVLLGALAVVLAWLIGRLVETMAEDFERWRD
jgi:cell division protein FtsL